MRLDLLWWRHLRGPRPHVAEETLDILSKERVIDMSRWLTELEVNSTAFSTLLMTLNGTKELDVPVISHWNLPVGEVVRDMESAESYTVTANVLANPGDWFDTTRRVTLVRQGSWEAPEIKHHWLEDELYPRLKEMP